MGHEVDLELDQPGLPVAVGELAGLSPGIHRVHFRTMDELGRWGLTSSIAVLISEPDEGFPVDRFDYLITESDGRVSDEGEIAGLSGAPPVFSASLLPSSGLVYLERHALTVFARDILGFVSEPSPEAHFVVMPPDEGWVRQYFSQEEIESGAASFRRDSDGDGASNAEEYAALTDPRDPDSVARPVVSVEDGFLHLSYDQRSGGTGTRGIDYSVDGVSIIAEASAGRLDAWKGGPDSISVLETSPTDRPGVERVTVRHNEPISGSDRGFLRLLYQGPQTVTSTSVAPSILWVSNNGPPAFSGSTAGTFHDAFVIMLQAQGYSVDRFNPPSSPTTLLTPEEVESINSYDLVIVGRATLSESFRSPQGDGFYCAARLFQNRRTSISCTLQPCCGSAGDGGLWRSPDRVVGALSLRW